jgi:hypothetical protein
MTSTQLMEERKERSFRLRRVAMSQMSIADCFQTIDQ